MTEPGTLWEELPEPERMRAKREAKREFFERIQERCMENCVWNYDNGSAYNRCNNGYRCINGELYLSEKEWKLDDNLNPIRLEAK